ncbi:MAG: DUF3830 family protein [Candidatus Thorarchaeota archaeon]
MKKIELEFKDSTVKSIGVLLEKDAPETCKAFWDALPLENEMVHSSWSGEAIIAHPCGVKVGADFPQENKTIFVGPGELTMETNVEELMIFYGRGHPRWRMGPIPMSVFGKIVDGLEDFAEQCKRLPKEGSKVLIIRRKE